MSTTEERDEKGHGQPIDQTAAAGPKSALIFDQRLVMMIVLAAFLTSFGQTQQIGVIPIRFLILKQMHLGPADLAKFTFISAAAWYFKPFVGLIVDSVPFFGTRRRSYMVAASGISIFLWIAVGFASATYRGLLYAALGLNVFMMIASTIMGALLVEYGQNKAATGGLSAARETVQDIGGILIGVVGGWLAGHSFKYTGYAGAGLLAILFLSSLFFLRERKVKQADTGVWHRAGKQVAVLFTSTQLWSAALMMLLIFLAPGFNSLLTNLQINTLHFTPGQVGILASLSAFGAVLGAVSYGFLCRFIDLRKLLVAGILLNVASTLIYFYYKSFHVALYVDSFNGLMSTLAILPVYDLAARATPKGCEGMGFSIMMAVRNVALFGSDWAGSQFATVYHVPFNTMLTANAGFTACVLILVPFIPRALVANRDGAMPATLATKEAELPMPETD